MEILHLLIPLAAVLVGVIVAGFLWVVRAGQFDDLEGPAHAILMDDDEDGPGTPVDMRRKSGIIHSHILLGPKTRNEGGDSEPKRGRNSILPP